MKKVGVIQTFLKFVKKYSTRQKMLEIFVSKFYKEITNVVNMSVFKQIEYLRKIS